jgi:hypothetical protein
VALAALERKGPSPNAPAVPAVRAVVAVAVPAEMVAKVLGFLLSGLLR